MNEIQLQTHGFLMLVCFLTALYALSLLGLGQKTMTSFLYILIFFLPHLSMLVRLVTQK